MLYDLLNSDYGNKERLNCSEKILYGSNEVYGLGLDKNSLKIAFAFGGGMAIESVCGAITGSLMVLGIFMKNKTDKEGMKEITRKFIYDYKKEMQEIYCGPLKDKYYREDIQCKNVILAAAKILDKTIIELKTKFEI